MAAGAARSAPLELFASCAPGLEPLVAAELTALGVRDAQIEEGGVSFAGSHDVACRANLWLRTASRVIARLGAFRARALGELERRSAGLPWEMVLAPHRPVRLRVTTHKSRLYHTGAIAERIANAIATHAGPQSAAMSAAADDDDADAAIQLIVVRLSHDRCTVSADTSGTLLHRRGYRLATARAPLRETLAAAMLMASGWDRHAPVVDPLCGSGTIIIEAALMARDMAPGLHRDFALRHWPSFDAAVWTRAHDEALARVRPAAVNPIIGSDRDAGAIAAAVSNAERAGVAADVSFARRALSAVTAPAAYGWLVTNPPYGVRIGERGALRDLYARLGQIAQRAFAGWTVALLSADRQLTTRTRLALEPRVRTRNGGIPVEIVTGVA